jgi:hypothetical protein
VARFNDELRRYGRGGQGVVTRGVLASLYLNDVLDVKNYEFHGIGSENPYGENDFGSVTVRGEKHFFKIGCYDPALKGHSPDKADLCVTRRVLRIMRAEEY